MHDAAHPAAERVGGPLRPALFGRSVADDDGVVLGERTQQRAGADVDLRLVEGSHDRGGDRANLQAAGVCRQRHAGIVAADRLHSELHDAVDGVFHGGLLVQLHEFGEYADVLDSHPRHRPLLGPAPMTAAERL
jgi:hypothetical protein